MAVESNAVVAGGSPASIWGGSYWQGTRGADRSLYRPVTVASYAWERAIAGGAHPAVSHAVNLLLHAGVCWLLFALAVSLGVGARAAMLGALLFAVTPSKSEAVANVVGRAEILAALFTLGAVRLAMIRGSRAAAWGAAACVFLACGSKETGMLALPLVAIAALGGGSWIETAGAIAPSVAAVVVAAVLRTRALEAFFPAQTVPLVDNPLIAETAATRIATALALVLRYGRIVLVPLGLSNDYSGATVTIERSPLAWRPLAGLAVLGGIAWLGSRARAASLFAAIALLPFLLVSNLVVPVGAIAAERFLYLPVVGLCGLAALGIDRAGRRGALVAMTLIAVSSVAMIVRARDWRDDRAIFEATARHNPKSPRAPYWLGYLAAEAGRPDEALGRFDDAIRAWPASAAPWHDRGVLLAKRQDLAGAEAAFREAVRLNPTWASARINLALVLHRRGDLEAAIREARHATLADTEDARSFAELGHLYYETSRPGPAATAYARAVALGRADLLPRLRELQALSASPSATSAPGSAPPR